MQKGCWKASKMAIFHRKSEFFDEKITIKSKLIVIETYIWAENHPKRVLVFLLFILFLVTKLFSPHVKAFSCRLYVLFISFSLRNDSCCMYELFLFDCLCFAYFFLVNFWFSLHVWAFSFWLTFLYQSLSRLPLSLRSFFIWFSPLFLHMW